MTRPYTRRQPLNTQFRGEPTLCMRVMSALKTGPKRWRDLAEAAGITTRQCSHATNWLMSRGEIHPVNIDGKRHYNLPM